MLAHHCCQVNFIREGIYRMEAISLQHYWIISIGNKPPIDTMQHHLYEAARTPQNLVDGSPRQPFPLWT